MFPRSRPTRRCSGRGFAPALTATLGGQRTADRKDERTRGNQWFSGPDGPDHDERRWIMIRAFLSFVEEDLNVVNLFRGQAKSENSDLEFADYSIKEPFDSRNADYIARGITDQLRLASLTACLYGPTTYTSKWVDWELRKSIDLGKPIMGVCLYGDGRVRY